MTITDLGARKGESVVSIATDLLGMAQRGEITMLVVTYVHADGDIGFVVSAGDSFYKLTGAVSQTLFEMHLSKVIK